MKFLAVLMSLVIATPAWAGWEVGNAGDSFAAEFILTAKDVALRLKMLPQSEMKDFNLDQLTGAILNTTVRTEANLTYQDGHEVEAINYPERKLIVVNRSVWRERRAASNTSARYTFVLHEYLGIMGIDDAQFRISSRLVSLMDVKDYSLSKFWNPLNPANHVSIGLVFSEPGCTIENIAFDLQRSEEILISESKGSCEDHYRKVTIIKSSATAPPASHARGTFHRFQIVVSDINNQVIGKFDYEPEWGKCLIVQEGSCQLSGKIQAGGVEFSFWLLHQ